MVIRKWCHSLELRKTDVLFFLIQETANLNQFRHPTTRGRWRRLCATMEQLTSVQVCHSRPHKLSKNTFVQSGYAHVGQIYPQNQRNDLKFRPGAVDSRWLRLSQGDAADRQGTLLTKRNHFHFFAITELKPTIIPTFFCRIT